MTDKQTKPWFLGPVLVMALAIGVSACSSTWEGAKKDTKKNVEATGESLEKAGENIKKSVD
ncbi:MAG: hypothetical protein H6905_10325 [Hyphomicrobiales bacterium]|nr:hypothetical protein [Hyphomicrobiales bacterium]